MALRESEATARALINAPTDSVILIDDKGTVLAINEIAASRFGKRSDDIVGTMSYDLLPKEVAQLRRVLMAPILEKKDSVRFVDERAGRWYDTVAYPILNEAGDVKKIAIIARDITEQKNIEKQLRESQQLYQRLLEQSFDAIAIHKDNKIAYLNRRAARDSWCCLARGTHRQTNFRFDSPRLTQGSGRTSAESEFCSGQSRSRFD